VTNLSNRPYLASSETRRLEKRMCKFASFIAKRNGDVLWFPGVDGHYQILELAGIDDSTDRVARELAKVEITPPKRGRRAVLLDWDLRVDEETQPMWWEDGLHGAACYAALARLIKAEAKGFEIILPDTSYIVGKRERGVWVGVHEEVRSDGGWCRESWLDGKRHGKAVDVWADGSSATVMYRHGRQHGFEEEIEPDGSWARHLYCDGGYVRTTYSS